MTRYLVHLAGFPEEFVYTDRVLEIGATIRPPGAKIERKITAVEKVEPQRLQFGDVVLVRNPEGEK